MKKLFLKLSVLVMVLTLVTLPLVSGTYAKYTTAADGTDTARVAKWGVTVTADVQNVFGDAYQAAAGGHTSVDYATADVTVQSATDNTDVLAPGTEGSFTFGVAGTPEVSVGLVYDATVTLTGWTVIAANDYQPINFTLFDGTHFATTAGAFTSDTAVSLTGAQLDTIIDGLDSTNDPLTALTKTYTVAWEWPFEKAGNFSTLSVGTDVSTHFVANGSGYQAATGKYVPGTTYYTSLAGTTQVDTSHFLPAGNISYDFADTILGNLATAPTLLITVSITATQID